MVKHLKPMYKPDRLPLRKRGILGKLKASPETISQSAPINCIDALPNEIAMALTALAIECKVKIGRACGYEPIKDRYTVIGKSMVTGKAQDFDVSGESVGDLIKLFRALNGGRAVPGTMG